MNNLKYDIILISFGDQLISDTFNKRYVVPTWTHFKKNNDYIGKLLNNYHLVFESDLVNLKSYLTIHDVKLFNYDNKRIIYTLVSEKNNLVKEIDNNFLIKESQIRSKYINLSLNKIENIDNLIYDKNKFKIILLFNYPLIYQFDEEAENDLILNKYINSSYSQIVFENIGEIFISDIFKLEKDIKAKSSILINKKK